MRRSMHAVLATGVLCLAFPGLAWSATKGATIDFNSVSSPASPTGEGLVVDSVSSGNGISGDALTGSVAIFGDSQDPAITSNAAVVFDATCSVDGAGGVCSGGDQDLFKPELGNILIIAEDLVDANGNGRIDDPDDADLPGQSYSLDFAALEGGKVNVVSIDVLDVEGEETGGVIEAFAGGISLGTVAVPNTDDNGLATVPVGIEGADSLKITMNGSGAIDNLRIEIEEEEPPGGEGCTPGYWKNHLDAWGPAGFSPPQALSTVFSPAGLGTLGSSTLLAALDFGGGSRLAQKKQILLRAAVASILNAAHPDVAFGQTVAQVVSAVNGALESNDKDTIIDLATALDRANNQGCPLN